MKAAILEILAAAAVAIPGAAIVSRVILRLAKIETPRRRR